jgi:transcriptional regulator with XRE-family HTH domain
MNASELVDVARVRSLVKSGAARSIRLAAGVGLYEMAAAAGCDPSTLWRWEAGERVPSAEHAIRYGKVLEELARR